MDLSTGASSPYFEQDIVAPEELEYFVQSLCEFQLHEVGSEQWMNCHGIIIKLTQQAIIEANSCREESVKEYLILHSKLQVLVHEAYCIMIWKTKIYPLLFEIDPQPNTTFLIYIVLYHEGSVINLLELCLYHQSGCESLGELAIDLLDYCAQAIMQLVGLIHMGHHENFSNVDVDDTIMTEIERQKRDIVYGIGMKCISILNYLIDKADVLLLSVGKRMVTSHDIPCLLSEILHLKPWLRKTEKGIEKFRDGKWTSCKGDEILNATKTEAQAWLAFRQLLFNPKIMEFYEINDFRRIELTKCQGLLNDPILDQIPPLIELKHYLSTLSLTGSKQSQNLNNLLLEEIPNIKRKILNNARQYSDNDYSKIAEEQAQIFLICESDEIFKKAKRLSHAYNFEFFEKFENSPKTEQKNTDTETKEDEKDVCSYCQKEATKKCSNCKLVYYCSKSCQVKDWQESHKKVCLRSLTKQNS